MTELLSPLAALGVAAEYEVAIANGALGINPPATADEYLLASLNAQYERTAKTLGADTAVDAPSQNRLDEFVEAVRTGKVSVADFEIAESKVSDSLDQP